MKSFFLLFLIPFTSIAQSYFATRSSDLTPLCDRSFVELKNLPPVRDQGPYGICYVHSSSLLLEYLRCKNTANPAQCYSNQGSILNLARYRDESPSEKIVMGGDTRQLLLDFKKSMKLASEKCAPYDAWKKLDGLHVEERNRLKATATDKDDIDYFYYIHNRLRRNATQDDIKCFANELSSVGLNQSYQDILAILNNGYHLTYEELRYKMLVPKSCMNDMIQYPEYTLYHYPRSSDKRTHEGFRNFIYWSLAAGYPIEAGFKTDSGAHSLSIVGQRHVCDRSQCVLQYRLQNSWGKSWQESHDNGWVNAQSFIERMMDEGSDYSVNSILPPTALRDTTVAAPYYENRPAGVTSSQNCVSTTSSVSSRIPAPIPTQASRPAPTVPVKKPETNQPAMNVYGPWKCVLDGKTSYSDYPVENADCKKM